MWNIKDDLKTVGNSFTATIDFHSREKILWKSVATIILQNILFYVKQKKEIHSGLEQQKGAKKLFHS